MEIDVISGNNGADRLKTLLHEFIAKKIRHYDEIQDIDIAEENHGGISRDKYHASLWMVFALMNITQQKEIAEESGISYEFYEQWNSEETFRGLSIWHYREFLEYIIDLYA